MCPKWDTAKIVMWRRNDPLSWYVDDANTLNIAPRNVRLLIGKFIPMTVISFAFKKFAFKKKVQVSSRICSKIRLQFMEFMEILRERSNDVIVSGDLIEGVQPGLCG